MLHGCGFKHRAAKKSPLHSKNWIYQVTTCREVDTNLNCIYGGVCSWSRPPKLAASRARLKFFWIRVLTIAKSRPTRLDSQMRAFANPGRHRNITEQLMIAFSLPASVWRWQLQMIWRKYLSLFIHRSLLLTRKRNRSAGTIETGWRSKKIDWAGSLIYQLEIAKLWKLSLAPMNVQSSPGWRCRRFNLFTGEYTTTRISSLTSSRCRGWTRSSPH